MSDAPTGEKRKVAFLGGAAIDGAPIAYIVVLAAVTTALAFIPFSFALAGGGSFPLSQGIWALLGILLGPIAGAISVGIGTLIAIFVAPHTAGVPVVTLLQSILCAFAAGCMSAQAKRGGWWIIAAVLGGVGGLYYIGRAISVNGVSLGAAVLGSLIQIIGWLLYVLPTRNLFGKWVGSKNVVLLALGVILCTATSFAVAHFFATAITYTMFNWPQEVFLLLASIIPVEYMFRFIVAGVIGVGVIVGLRAIGLVKPERGLY
ncbi:MAG: hypothetical protein HPY45_17760 [Anaerolineae bacterium]|nr:hypothetical protein [Anaerolineae bacterium]